MIRVAVSSVLVAGILLGAITPGFAESAVAPVVAPRPVAPIDREAWAGISYREALVGLAVLGGGGIVVTWLSGSVISGITAAAALSAGYIVYDPGVTGVRSPSDLPTLPDLAVNGDGGDQK